MTFKLTDTLLKEHKDDLAYFVSNHDLTKFVKGASEEWVRYGELDKLYDSMHELLPKPMMYKFILTEFEPNKGHWCIIMRYANTVEWFDPYGSNPTHTLNFISRAMNKKLDNTKSDITDLIKTVQSPDKFIYNKTAFQAEADGVNTCGKHCLLRLQMMIMGHDLKSYAAFMKQMRKKMNMPYDIVVSTFIPLKEDTLHETKVKRETLADINFN